MPTIVEIAQVEPTLPEFISGEGEDSIDPFTEYYPNDYSDDQKASETIVDQATFRIKPLNSGDNITLARIIW